MPWFEEHPQRRLLNDEVHARPPVPLETPEFVSYLAFLHVEDSASREAEHLNDLAEQLGLAEPDASTGHVSLDAGAFRLRWERHTEFSSYTFFHRSEGDDTVAGRALLAVPAAWRSKIPGQLIVATHVEVRDADDVPPETVIAQDEHQFSPVVASGVTAGAGWVLTDFQIVDGFSRFIVFNRSLTPRQAGRTVQRLVEIETYRVMALLAFPVAKEVGRLLARAENELADLTDAMGRSTATDDERSVLNRLTRLAADIERSVARTSFRFGAAAAYYQLVRQRIEDLREVRLDGFPPIREFMDRRLAPAIATCATMARRQEDLSSRIARNSQLLRTRVDIELERQNQELLAQMNRRAKLQLRLQETVEGLSVVAITYYGSQLVQYLAKGGKDFLTPATPEVVTAVSIPIIAGLVALGLRRMRRQLAAEEAAPGH
ncbi:MAG: DUF3422 domain-containing protein [Aromatoleum sp.]|jgi:uncharacterized membrane-anchored protein|uniref:DUF3422 family protein n=1 Tax=Aromatoleum sp. TaxID=2307007 RepID=UPI0028954A12|nr:DUF3422 domain-containing protein [Aromatoleum sp.]MDT3668795.1 DUF3422 domain-containing protein [Aromatoleum sp.]